MQLECSEHEEQLPALGHGRGVGNTSRQLIGFHVSLEKARAINSDEQSSENMPCSKATLLLSLPSLKGTFVFLYLFKLPRAGLVNILSVGYSSGKLTKGIGNFFPHSCNPWHLVPAPERDSGSKHLPG